MAPTRRDVGVAREDAIAAARAAEPAEASVDPADAELAGLMVTVSATDYGRDPIRGTLVGSSPQHVAIRREEARTGAVVIHVPRLGFAVSGG